MLVSWNWKLQKAGHSKKTTKILVYLKYYSKIINNLVAFYVTLFSGTRYVETCFTTCCYFLLIMIPRSHANIRCIVHSVLTLIQENGVNHSIYGKMSTVESGYEKNIRGNTFTCCLKLKSFPLQITAHFYPLH